MNKFVVFCAILLLGSASAANWAVLVAGSNGFYNYRHQADICHAYKTLLAKGMPAENIIVFAYDDIAKSSQNPFPGKLFNKPNGDDVYAGCVIDYKGADVTPKNFLSVLKQDAAAMKNIGTGRVLKSTGKDKVFINFSDHGAAGLIAFPSTYLYAKDLTPVLVGMKAANQYDELVFYLEACESGSMFNTFPTDKNLYALTAANPDESSWADYCPPEDVIQGKHIGSCLGDLFSTNWMEDTDTADTTTETLQQQYVRVKQLTSQSNVMQYGTLSFTNEPVGNFVGNKKTTAVKDAEKSESAKSLVNSRDVTLMYLISKHSRQMSNESQMELNKEIASRRFFDETFEGVKKIVGQVPRAMTTNWTCYVDMIESFESACGKTTDYGLKYLRIFYDACAHANADNMAIKLFFSKKCLNTASA